MWLQESNFSSLGEGGGLKQVTAANFQSILGVARLSILGFCRCSQYYAAQSAQIPNNSMV